MIATVIINSISVKPAVLKKLLFVFIFNLVVKLKIIKLLD